MGTRKTAVQLTMFRVVNYGSALQAYALRQAILGLGYECRTIDYLAKVRDRMKRPTNVRDWIDRLKWWLIYHKRNARYAIFLKKELNLTEPYLDFTALVHNPPAGDVYITGSDQTFNPNCSKGDPAYFLSFVPEARRNQVRKISYASSFAVTEIPTEYVEDYRQGLADFDALSTREETGVGLIERLTGRRDARWCCDPTLLLPRSHWEMVAEKTEERIRKPYILVYLLAYMVNPFPEIERIIREAQKATGYQVIYLNGRRQDIGKPNSRVIKSASPYRFVDLFLNASLIITSSFHGVVFSLHSGAPFIACVNGDMRKDSRVHSLLSGVGAEKNMVTAPIADTVHFDGPEKWIPATDVQTKVTAMRESSLAWLHDNIGRVASM